MAEVMIRNEKYRVLQVPKSSDEPQFIVSIFNEQGNLASTLVVDILGDNNFSLSWHVKPSETEKYRANAQTWAASRAFYALMLVEELRKGQA